MNAPLDGPNPFAQQVVADPHDARSTAESIHREQFEQILQLFSSLEQAPQQRLQRGPPIQLVLSQEPGCGKSHLLGRLWRTLADRAVVVYLRAHEDRYGFWQRILERLMLELEHPLDAAAGASTNRLDGMARHLLADLFIEAVKRRYINNEAPEVVAAAIRAGTPEVRAKLRKQLPELLKRMTSVFQQRMLDAGLGRRHEAEAWLKVLAHYTLDPADAELRTLAVYWMQGNALEPGECDRFGLSRLQSNGALMARPEELSAGEIALHCLCSLCAFAAWFRPIVFAFDQTEIYGQTPELAAAFGMTLERLWSECVNKLIVVTANEHPWYRSVWNCLQQADRDRFDGRVVHINGIGREQARELVTVKMREAGYAQDRIEEFLCLPWLDRLFPDAIARPSPRSVERDASQALQRLVPKPPEPAKPEPVADAATRLREAFEGHRLRILRTPGATDFDIGVLQWMLATGLSGLAGPAAETNFRAPRGYLSARWQCGTSEKLYFVLNTSTHWNRWRAIVREYREHADRDRAGGCSARGIVLWHRSLKAIGEGMRKRLASPEAQGLEVLQLSDEDIAELYAGQAVFADLCQGDLERVDHGTLIAFLGERLKHWARRFRTAAESAPDAGPSAPTSPAPRALPPELLADIVRTAGMLAWPVLQSRLAERGLTPSIEQILLACQPLSAQIKVFSTPTNHLFVWQQPST
jgi:hypothetical protein